MIVNKIAAGQIEPASAAAATPPPTCPSCTAALRRRFLLQVARAKTTRDSSAAFKGFSFRELKPDSLASPNRAPASRWATTARHGQGMEHPRDSQDEPRSNRTKLAAAYERGLLRRPGGQLPRRLARQQPAPRHQHREAGDAEAGVRQDLGRGTLTAGNSTLLTDGAAACLIAPEEWAAKHGHEVLCRIRDTQVAAVDFVHGEGLLMAPTVAVPEMLARNGLTLQDFDLYEIHELLRESVRCARESEEYRRNRLGLAAPLGRIDPARLNINGSSLATGHPFAATGARIVATAAKELKQRGKAAAAWSASARRRNGRGGDGKLNRRGIFLAARPSDPLLAGPDQSDPTPARVHSRIEQPWAGSCQHGAGGAIERRPDRQAVCDQYKARKVVGSSWRYGGRSMSC